jgi:hypothetical protein
LTVPANTSSPAAFDAGHASPVIGDWSTSDRPDVTVPSTGTRPPGRTTTTSPTATSPMGTSRSTSPRRTVATSGASVIRDRMARRDRAMLWCSSHSAMPKSHTTAAASSHSPSAAAPATAISMSTLMSSTLDRRALNARRAGATTAIPIATKYPASPANGQPHPVATKPARMARPAPVSDTDSRVRIRGAAGAGDAQTSSAPQQASLIGCLPRRASACRGAAR